MFCIQTGDYSLIMTIKDFCTVKWIEPQNDFSKGRKSNFSKHSNKQLQHINLNSLLNKDSVFQIFKEKVKDFDIDDSFIISLMGDSQDIIVERLELEQGKILYQGNLNSAFI